LLEPLEDFVVPSDLDPGLYATTRRPVMQAETLPPAAYTSREFYDREVERIFMREWNFMGRADHIARPGDYAALDYVGIPLILSRDKDGALHALINSCRHRGSVVAEGEGNCRAFRCPYHSWVYDLDGRLLRATEMDRTADWDPARYPLRSARLETWGGFLFVSFDAAAPSLREYLGDLPGKLESYRLEDMICVRRKSYRIACNWKLFVENAMEELHIPTVHRKTIQQNTPMETHEPEKADGQYCALFSTHEGTMALLKGDAGFPPIPTRRGKAATGTYFVMLYPSTMLGVTSDCMWYLELRPQGPAETTLIHGACFPTATVARPDFDDVAQNYFNRWETTTLEDIEASERQQRGLSSPFSARGRFSHHEVLVHEIDNWVLDRVFGPQA
jgi:phenylpropionate dioxygenase-like ring-hydroxylating dioxygenase large terminal subunit